MRYPSLDALRGLALVAMASAHLTYVGGSSYVEQVTHAAAWVDGAFFFVALSGVVTGLVHRRLVARRGLRASSAKLVRRSALIYAVHVGLVVLTVSAASIEPNLLHETPTWSELGGGVAGMREILSLTLQPNFIDVLPMYVVFLLLPCPRWRRSAVCCGAVPPLAIDVDVGFTFGGNFPVDGSLPTRPGSHRRRLGLWGPSSRRRPRPRAVRLAAAAAALRLRFLRGRPPHGTGRFRLGVIAAAALVTRPATSVSASGVAGAASRPDARHHNGRLCSWGESVYMLVVYSRPRPPSSGSGVPTATPRPSPPSSAADAYSSAAHRPDVATARSRARPLKVAMRLEAARKRFAVG